MRHEAHKNGRDVPKQYAKPFTELQMFEDRLPAPLSWRKPCKVFVNSMSDLFHKDVPDSFIDQVFGVMAKAYWHTFQVLTKRPERMAEYLTSDGIRTRTIEAAQGYQWPRWAMADVTHNDRGWNVFPYPNIHLGTSVENQQTADARIPHLLRVPARVRFLSMEPLLGTVDLRRAFDLAWGGEPGHVQNLNWVIVGGESGHGARPCNVQWIRDIVKQCKEASVPVFVKQLGANVEWNGIQGGYGDGLSDCWPGKIKADALGGRFRVHLKNKKGDDMAEWPEDLRVRDFPA